MPSPTSASRPRALARATAGLAIGGASAFAELGFVLIGSLASTFPRARPAVARGAGKLAGFERRRLARFLGVSTPGGNHAPDGNDDARALPYLAVRCVVGGLGAGIFLLIGLGLVTGAIAAWQLLTGRAPGGGEPLSWYDPLTYLLLGALLAFLAVQGLFGVATLDRRLARHFLEPTTSELLRRRVSELSVSRAEVLEAVNDERRRIERDLHDGVQQRLVALGMLLGRARRSGDTEHAGDLLRQAHEATQETLRDLREVTWRVYPITLDESGLAAAIESLAERAHVPVRVRCELPQAPTPAIGTVAYFVASEAVNNALKHADAGRIDIDIVGEFDSAAAGDSILRVRVADDGIGGADPAGSGLSGLARRVAAADGEFTVDSPLGGPTTVTATIPQPCGPPAANEGRPCE